MTIKGNMEMMVGIKEILEPALAKRLKNKAQLTADLRIGLPYLLLINLSIRRLCCCCNKEGYKFISTFNSIIVKPNTISVL